MYSALAYQPEEEAMQRVQFSLKCVRRLGDITTDDEGVAIVSFAYPSSSVGNAYAFEMHPEGAPAGNRYQSAQVAF
jgi:hypothetical protein